jgi:DNA-binding transcriptional LysR family regulator
MKIDTLGVQAFIAIADAGAFGRAAESLRITQTALSRRLQNLETFLGVKLVERTTRSVALTRIGEDFLPQARRLLGELAAALTEIRETGKAMRGDVTLACIPTASVHFLPHIIRAYTGRHPGNRVRVLDLPAPEVAAAVLRREVEFGISMRIATHPELTASRLLEDRYVVVCLRHHPLAKKRRLTWKQLEPHSLILSGHESGARALVEVALRAKHVKLGPFHEVQRSSTAVSMVAEGIGIAIVPSLGVRAGGHRDLAVIPLVEPVVAREIVLLARTRAQLAPAAQALYDLIAQMRPRAESSSFT